MPFPDCLIAVPLVAAIISLWFSNRVWIVLLLLTLGAGFFLGRIALVSIPFITLGFLLAVGIDRVNRYKSTLSHQTMPMVSLWLLHGLLILWMTALLTHKIPGFNNVLLLDHVYVSQDAIPFTLYLNLDKPLAIFALYIAIPGLLGTGMTNPHYTKPAWLVILFGLAVIMLMACLIGLVRPEFKIPSWWWLFALNNLLITCVAEATVFRGYLQQQLGQCIGWLPAVICSSLLYGVLHYPGGWAYASIVVLSGLVYGFAFHISGRLWVSVITQFLLNFIHLIFFTYPMLVH